MESPKFDIKIAKIRFRRGFRHAAPPTALPPVSPLGGHPDPPSTNVEPSTCHTLGPASDQQNGDGTSVLSIISLCSFEMPDKAVCWDVEYVLWCLPDVKCYIEPGVDANSVRSLARCSGQRGSCCRQEAIGVSSCISAYVKYPVCIMILMLSVIQMSSSAVKLWFLIWRSDKTHM